MTQDEYGLLLLGGPLLVAILLASFCCEDEAEREDEDRSDVPHPQAPAPAEQRVAPPVKLPYFLYAPLGRASERLVCAICLEQLTHGELCSEVPACRHVFHGECVGVWMKTSDSCPLCRVNIVPRSRGVSVAVADDMV